MIYNDKSRQAGYRNMVNDPDLAAWESRGYNNFCACGLAATGDDIAGEEPTEELEPVRQKVINMQAWRYAKTALALVGVYVVIKFIISYIKK